LYHFKCSHSYGIDRARKFFWNTIKIEISKVKCCFFVKLSSNLYSKSLSLF
jgi:hypothetical protein